MAVLFANGTNMYTDVGSPASLDNLTTKTVLVLCRLDSFSPSGMFIIAKKADAGTGAGWRFSLSGTSGAITFNQRMASDAYSYVSGDTLAAPAGTWRWLAFTFDPSGTSGQKCKLYGGPFGGTLAVTSSYTTSTDAASGANSDAAQNVRLGNATSANSTVTPTGAFEYFAIWNSVLTLANLQDWIDGKRGSIAAPVDDWYVGYDAGTAAKSSSGSLDGTTTTGTTTPGVLEIVTLGDDGEDEDGMSLSDGALAMSAVSYVGATDQSYEFVAVNRYTGARMTGLAYTDFQVKWGTPLTAFADVTEATQTSTGAHADWGIVEKGNGVYRIDAADAVQVTGPHATIDIHGINNAAAMRDRTIPIALPASSPYAAGLSEQDISDAVWDLADIDGDTAREAARLWSSSAAGENDPTGTQAAPKLLARDGSKVRIDTSGSTPGLRDVLAVDVST